MGGGWVSAGVSWGLKRGLHCCLQVPRWAVTAQRFYSHALPMPACVFTGEKKPILLTWQRFPVVKPAGYRQFCCQLSAESCCCWLNPLPSPSVNAAFTQLTQAVRNELILYLVSSSLYHTQTTQGLWECLKDLWNVLKLKIFMYLQKMSYVFNTL